MNTAKKPVVPPLSYRVVCERCRKLVFYTGQNNVGTITVICDECSQSIMLTP